MPAGNPQLARVFRDEVELCRLQQDESVAILYQAESREEYLPSLLSAVEMIGADASPIQLPGFKHSMFPYGGGSRITDVDGYMKSNPHVMSALQESDLVFDITAEGLVHTKTTADILEGNTRVVLVKEPPAVLERMMPRESLRERVEAADDIIQDGESMRVTSEAGTDVTMKLGIETPTIAQYGYSPEQGHWDNFPGGFLAAYPIDDSINGTIVIDIGDVILPIGQYLDNQVRVEVEDGMITDIQGSDSTHAIIDGYLDRWDDPEAYATSHFGFGLDETAEWENWAFCDGQDLMGQDFRGYPGGFMWSTGPNRYVERYTRSHLDIVMRNCSFWIDDQQIIKAGELADSRISPP